FGEVFQPTSIYWFYVALTPIVFALTYLGTLRASKSPFPQSVMAWPWWRTIASTIAFGVWALAVPENPYLAMKPAAAPLFALGALVVSSLLSMLEPIVSPQ
ncbi:MAG TPA: hypothetical protein VGO11_08595, partial [Chthoniobacteraceae bacterium]|nr:hypothetical protein [Chthoniobacteraceae bacterium]